MQSTNIGSREPIPERIAKEIDVLYLTLSKLSALLSIGRCYGLAVGVSPSLLTELNERRIPDPNKNNCLENLWSVDPSKPANP